MRSSQYLAAFTALLLSGVDAAVLPRDSEPGCSILNARPSKLACSKQGYIDNDSGKLGGPQSVPQPHNCADLCAKTASCTFFNFRPEGFCQLFSGDFSSVGHREEASGSYFSQLECYQCRNADTLFSLDFEDKDVAPWGLEMDKDGDFYMDIQKRDSWSLRVLEATDQGTVQVKYSPTFHLEPGSSYRLTFLAKSNKENIEPFDLIRTVITRGDQTIFEGFPEYPAQYPWGWHQFYSKFMVGEGQGGQASFMFKIEASGSQLDWYFDGLALQKV
ncbi:hypothetical protein ACHAPT_011215 [Fusarium lateritium]